MTPRRLTTTLLMLSAMPALGPSSAVDVRAEMLRGNTADLVIKAVRAQDGRAAAHTGLFVSGGNEVFGKWEKRVTTNGAGVAIVRLPVGEYRIHPLDSAFANIWSGTSNLPQSEPVTVRLQPACTISGRVTDDKGRPLADSRLEVWADAGNIDLVPDGRGEFSVGRLSASMHPITAYAAGYAPSTLRVAVRAGEHRRGVQVVLRRGATLTVTANCGSKCLGAQIKVTAAEETYATQDVDANGVAVFRDLPAGEVVVQGVRAEALPGELASPPIKRQLAPAENASLELVLAPTGGHASLHGMVVSKSGKPLYASIEVDCASVRRQATSDRDGTFVVRDLPEGPHCTVTATKDGGLTKLETDGSVPLTIVIDSPVNP